MYLNIYAIPSRAHTCCGNRGGQFLALRARTFTQPLHDAAHHLHLLPHLSTAWRPVILSLSCVRCRALAQIAGICLSRRLFLRARTADASTALQTLQQ